MFLQTALLDGTRVSIIAPRRTVDRLATTCFRGRRRAFAGNFREYSRIDHAFEEREIRDGLKRNATDVIFRLLNEEAPDKATFSVTIDVLRGIGWESTERLDRLPAEALEWFEPNRKSRALRVKSDRTDILAPVTSLVTIVFELRFEGDGPQIVVFSMYPGTDIGDLCGNVTEREGRAFFPWEHPGA